MSKVKGSIQELQKVELIFGQDGAALDVRLHNWLGNVNATHLMRANKMLEDRRHLFIQQGLNRFQTEAVDATATS